MSGPAAAVAITLQNRFTEQGTIKCGAMTTRVGGLRFHSTMC